jgi:hypothetical protein
MMNSLGVFGSIAMLLSIGGAILWLVIGWRAMRAHERLADAVDRMSRDKSGNPPHS